MAELLIVVPARSRPWNIARVLAAWTETGAWGHADLRVEVDADDPTLAGYQDIEMPAGARLTVADIWRPLVPKLERVVEQELDSYWAIGFAGCDHVPETVGWAKTYLDELHDLGTGIVYGDDGYQHANTPTQWAMTADIVRALGRMVPAPVEHMYCDDALRDLGRAAGCIRYLPDVVIRHHHPAAGIGKYDEQYKRVNSSEQYRRDRNTYRHWLNDGLPGDVAKVQALR